MGPGDDRHATSIEDNRGPPGCRAFPEMVECLARAFANNHLLHCGGAEACTLVPDKPNWHFFTRDAETAIAVMGDPIGMKVSIDVSTGDDDAGHRVFGRVVERQPEDIDGHGKVLVWRLLCDYESDNFGMRTAPK
jgi:hypothetical protein